MYEIRTRRKFDREFKVEAVGLVTEGGRPITCVAREPGIHRAVLSSLRREWVHLDTYCTRNQPRQSSPGHIESFYNRVRRHSALGYCSPTGFETLNSVA